MSSKMVMVCQNSECNNQPNPDTWCLGWPLRNNSHFATLCHPCGSIYEDGKFCETFHKYASGWRCCETCGKRVHCGCIVSVHTFVVLDAGGVECTVCARQNVVRTASPAWPPRDLPRWPMINPMKNWDQNAAPGSTASCQQIVNLCDKSAANSDSGSRTSVEVDRSTGVEKSFCNDRVASSPWNQSWNLSFSDGTLELNGSRAQADGQCTLHSDLASSFPLATQADNQTRAFSVHSQLHSPRDAPWKQFRANCYKGISSSLRSQTCNDKPVDQWVQKDSLPRYWHLPKMSNEGLRGTSGGSTAVITPLFEKVLSASDTSPNGRLVIPEKCAETFFPAISQPEGLPLQVQDITGKKWILQFRFWPKSNSRMYVLEGMSNCIQSLQVQAGDVVSFGRIKPEGEFVIGFRKASTSPQSDQAAQAAESGNQGLKVGDVGSQKPRLNEILPTALRSHPISECNSPTWQTCAFDPAIALSKFDKSGCIVKEAIGASLSAPSKRKQGIISLNRKHSKVMKVTLVEAQRLFRPPTNHARQVATIDDFDFEEYEEAPVIGRSTANVKDSFGEDIQWAQCDDCLKWRRLPFNFLLPARWTCSENLWDPDRASCDSAQQLTAKQVKDLLAIKNTASSKKLQVDFEVLAGFSTKGSEAGPASSEPSTKHPHHRPDCSCFACTQPPSGMGLKHKQNCMCNVCITVRRCFQKNKKLICTPNECHIGLNFQPEQMEEALACCDSAALKRITQNATERVLCNSGGEKKPDSNQSESCAGRLDHGEHNGKGHGKSCEISNAENSVVSPVDQFGAMVVELAAMPVSG